MLQKHNWPSCVTTDTSQILPLQSHNSDRQVKALRGSKKESQIINLNLLPPPPKSPKSKRKKNKRKKSGRRSKVGQERLRES